MRIAATPEDLGIGLCRVAVRRAVTAGRCSAVPLVGPAPPRDRPGAFTLVELLVVIAIIAMLVAILAPSLQRAKFLSRSTVCGTNMHSISVGVTTYATQNRSYYPARWPGGTGYYHPYWYGRPGSATKDLHEQFEQMLGPGRDGGPPQPLLCAVAPTGIWGLKITWPLAGIYRTNVCVYAGYDWSTASASACVPHQPLDQMPLRMHDAPSDRPVAGDLTEYMSENSTKGYRGWNTSHSSDPSYHNRAPGGPEDPPLDPIPFAKVDGSVVFTRDLEPCYTDPGWGTNYWPRKP